MKHLRNMFLVNFDCFDVWKIEIIFLSEHILKTKVLTFLIINSAVTPLQGVFLIIKDE